MANHFKGSIETDNDDHTEPYMPITLRTVDKYPHRIGKVWIDDAPEPDYNRLQEANAKRLVDCWNAMVEIADPIAFVAAAEEFMAYAAEFLTANADHIGKQDANLMGWHLDRLTKARGGC
jgi:hypothetical protein